MIQTSYSIEKWQRMAAIVSQYPEFMQADLIKQHKKLVIFRFFFGNLLTFLLQYMGLMLGSFPLPYPLSLAVGAACAFIFLRGINILPGIWLGSFIAYFLAKSPLTVAACYASVYTIEPLVLFLICYYFITPTLIFFRTKIFFKFVLCCFVLSGLINVMLLLLANLSLQHSVFTLKTLWPYWLANFTSIIIFSCIIFEIRRGC